MTAPDTRQIIVCVDDDETVLQSLGEQLRRGLGRTCAVELASSGEEAIALIDELMAEGAQVPLMISDHLMPGMRGTELLARVHDRYPAMLKILLTGRADADAVGEAVNRANLYRMLAKPWDEHDLLMTVSEALRRVAQEHALAVRSAALDRSHSELEQSMALLHATLDATHDGILVLDGDAQPSHLNRRMRELWQVPAAFDEPQSGAPLALHLRGQLNVPAALVLDPRQAPGEPVMLELIDGRAIEYSCRPHELGGQRVGSVFSFRDVTERQRNTQALRHRSLHDGLTGLANRQLFDEGLAQALARARLRQTQLAVMFIDLDRFKRINDTLGHDIGDELLCAVARRLSVGLREQDLLARWGGDEFTVLLPDLQSRDQALVVARRLIEGIAAPLQIGSHTMHISVSIGLAVYPEEGEDALTLVKHADTALYRVKSEGRNGVRSFGELASPHGASELALEDDLYEALARGQLQLHYQPQVDTDTGAVRCMEALARWQHPVLGWVPPATFIPLAEESGLITRLGEWVLEAACQDAAQWQARGWRELGVAVNLSARQFDNGQLPDTVARALARSGLAAHSLEVEVTEAAALRNIDLTASTLLELQRSGVRVGLDDFGTGFASLSYLKQLPCQTLKIDRSFVQRLQPETADAAIIRALVSLGKDMGLRVVAEGVETLASKTLLERLGCWTMQGYLFSRPLPRDDLDAWLDGAWRGAAVRQPAHYVAAPLPGQRRSVWPASEPGRTTVPTGFLTPSFI